VDGHGLREITIGRRREEFGFEVFPHMYTHAVQ